MEAAFQISLVPLPLNLSISLAAMDSTPLRIFFKSRESSCPQIVLDQGQNEYLSNI